jgi:hypothetical protein
LPQVQQQRATLIPYLGVRVVAIICAVAFILAVLMGVF